MQKLSRQGIGGSQISTVVGMNPFASPWDLWMEQTGQKEPQETNEPMEWGHRLEPAIRQKYVDETGAVVYVPTESMFHHVDEWARATPDGIAVNDSDSLPIWSTGRWLHLVQIKNVSYWMGKEWEQSPPPYVQLQEQWEMYVTGLQRADVACLIGGSDFRIFTIHRDDAAIASLVTIATDFWRRVEQRIPPAIDNSDACREHFEKRFAKANAVELVANDEIEDLFANWQHHTGEVKRASWEVDRIRNIVRSHLADAQANRIVSSKGVAKLDKNNKLLAPREWGKEKA